MLISRQLVAGLRIAASTLQSGMLLQPRNHRSREA